MGRFAGEWLKGEKSGLGIYYTTDGHVFKGTWQDGLWSGINIITVSNDNQVYIGGWKKGAKHGSGILYSANSRTIGKWNNGCMTGKGSIVNLEGKVIKELINGESKFLHEFRKDLDSKLKSSEKEYEDLKSKLFSNNKKSDS